jgi:hypothetical protein
MNARDNQTLILRYIYIIHQTIRISDHLGLVIRQTNRTGESHVNPLIELVSFDFWNHDHRLQKLHIKVELRLLRAG